MGSSAVWIIISNSLPAVVSAMHTVGSASTLAIKPQGSDSHVQIAYTGLRSASESGGNFFLWFEHCQPPCSSSRTLVSDVSGRTGAPHLKLMLHHLFYIQLLPLCFHF